MVNSFICDAIRKCAVLEFDYGGQHRIAHPYCHGYTRTGLETLRAVQVAGESPSGGFGYGKLWTVAKISNLGMAGTFVPDDPDYNPADTAMLEIHCRVL